MNEIQKIQVKFSTMTLTLEEIAEYINGLIKKVKDLEVENSKLKEELEKIKKDKE